MAQPMKQYDPGSQSGQLHDRRNLLKRLSTIAIVLSAGRTVRAAPNDPQSACAQTVDGVHYARDAACDRETGAYDADCGLLDKATNNPMSDGDCTSAKITQPTTEGRDNDCGKTSTGQNHWGDGDCGIPTATFSTQDQDCGKSSHSDSDCGKNHAPSSYNSDSDCTGPGAGTDGDCDRPISVEGQERLNNDGDDGNHAP